MKNKALKISKMRSENLRLEFTKDVTWESFPEKAKEFLTIAKGWTLFKSTTPEKRTWLVLINLRPFHLSYDNCSARMSLDSLANMCNPVIEELYNKLIDSGL
ncbi:MAG: hypothetical protein GY699_21930 [Desulfobacteraceae bacterium]|nr:hypothetical protein [Desulfobacteraceae bacterium]